MMHYCYGDGRGPREPQPGIEGDCPRCLERARAFQHPDEVNCKTLVRERFDPLPDEWVKTDNLAAVEAGMRRVVKRLEHAVQRL